MKSDESILDREEGQGQQVTLLSNRFLKMQFYITDTH